MSDERGVKPCPCGKEPNELIVTGTGKWACVYGDCCGQWIIEFRTMYKRTNSSELYALALEAWNEAPRDAAYLKILKVSEFRSYSQQLGMVEK